MTELEPRAGEALERMLGRYTRVRLDPTPAQSKRMRGVVMAEAWRRYLTRTSVIGTGGRTVGPRRPAFAAWSGRRVGASVVAAVVAGLLIGSSAFASSRAGGPLYDARLTLEQLTLPADPTARLEAEIAQAQGRVADLADAVSRGDEPAVDAAARAYARTIDDLDVTGGQASERALSAVRFHRNVLLELLSTAPTQALTGIEEALDHSTAVIDRLDATDGGPVTGAPAGAGNGNAGGNQGGNGTTNGAGNPGGAGQGGGGANAGGQGGAAGAGAQGGGSGGGSSGAQGAGQGSSQGAGQGGGSGGGATGAGDDPDHDGANGAGAKPDRTPRPTKAPPPNDAHGDASQDAGGGGN